jgi:hypothetical protein
MDIFSTREIAMVIWSLIFLGAILINKKIRKSIIDIIRIIFSRSILIPFIVILIYLVILLLLFTFKLGMREYIDLKEVILWVLFSGVPLCYGVVSKIPSKNYFKEIIMDNIRFVILIEFIISTFTFPLKIELVMVPIFTFFFLLEAVSDIKKEHQDVNKFISYILAIAGFLILYKSLSLAIKNYKELSSIESLVSIVTPIILSILYIPIMFIFSICYNYNNILYRLKVKVQFKLKVIKNNINNKKNNKYDYNAERINDVSTGIAKRKSITLILGKKYNLEDMENICIEQFDLYSYKNDVVWVYVATSQENYIISNWIMQAQWISPKLDNRWRPISLDGIKKDRIYFKYNNMCNEREEYYKKNIFKDDKFLFVNNFKLYDKVSDEINLMLETFKNKEYNIFFKMCNEYKDDIKDIYFKYGDIGLSTNINFENYLQVFQDYIASIDNIILYALDESRSVENKEYLINMIIKDLENTIFKIEDERLYWMNKFNIAIAEYEQAIFTE